MNRFLSCLTLLTVLCAFCAGAFAQDDHGDTPATATEVGEEVVYGEISTGTDVDFFMFTAQAGTIYNIQTAFGFGPAPIDPLADLAYELYIDFDFIDTNQDGFLSFIEVSSYVFINQSDFNAIDANNDSLLSMSEVEAVAFGGNKTNKSGASKQDIADYTNILRAVALLERDGETVITNLTLLSMISGQPWVCPASGIYFICMNCDQALNDLFIEFGGSKGEGEGEGEGEGGGGSEAIPYAVAVQKLSSGFGPASLDASVQGEWVLNVPEGSLTIPADPPIELMPPVLRIEGNSIELAQTIPLIDTMTGMPTTGTTEIAISGTFESFTTLSPSRAQIVLSLDLAMLLGAYQQDLIDLGGITQQDIMDIIDLLRELSFLTLISYEVSGNTLDICAFEPALGGDDLVMGEIGEICPIPTARFTLQAPVNAPVISVSPLVLDAGNVAVNESLTLVARISNTGTAPLVGQATVEGAGFSIQGNGAYTVAPGASRNIAVVFRPTAGGEFSGLLSLTGGGGAAVNLFGDGIASRATVSGSIVTSNEAPIPCATVSLRGNLFNAVASVDGDGGFDFINVPAGTYRLEAFAQGFRSNSADVMVTSGTDASQDLTLQARNASATTLIGRILQELGGSALGGVLIEIFDFNNPTVRLGMTYSCVDGDFDFEFETSASKQLPSAVMMRVTGDGFLPITQMLNLTAGQSNNAPQLLLAVDPTFGTNGNIQVEALDGATPVADATVTVSFNNTSRRSTTNAQGIATFAEMPAGQYSVRAVKDGLGDKRVNGTVFSGTEASVIQVQFGQAPTPPTTGCTAGSGTARSGSDLAVMCGALLLLVAGSAFRKGRQAD